MRLRAAQSKRLQSRKRSGANFMISSADRFREAKRRIRLLVTITVVARVFRSRFVIDDGRWTLLEQNCVERPNYSTKIGSTLSESRFPELM